MYKKLLPIAVILLAGCQKETPSFPYELMHDNFGIDYTVSYRKPVPSPARPTMPLEEATNKVVLLLDFDGGIVSGTVWNTGSDIYYDNSGFAPEEQKRILDSVRYDYSVFTGIIVTDNEQTYLNAPSRKRSRLILTTTFGFYGMAGGVSFVGSMNWGDNTPCFVFTSLLKFSTKKVQEAASHELGHTLGLYHKAYYENCVLKSEYDYGNADFAPIMGIAYNARRGGWTIGPTPVSCTDIQDDEKIINENSK